MKRYRPEVRDGSLFLTHEAETVEVGKLDDIVDAIGGETYRIEYDKRQRAHPWLDTDDGEIEIDIRESVTEMTQTPEFVAELQQYDMSTERYGLPTRTVEFASMFVDILEEQGTTG